MVLASAELLDPAGGEEVLLRPLASGNLAVGDVADEQMPEGVFAVALDSASALATDELLALERVQSVVERLPAGQRGQRTGPEARADHRGVLEHRLLLRLE